MTWPATGKGFPDVDDDCIDGGRLRLAREARGLSSSEAARMLTLSRAQVEQIESGGVTAFYSPRHKLLAVRKYAMAFGIDAHSVLILDPDTPVPESAAEQSLPSVENEPAVARGAGAETAAAMPLPADAGGPSSVGALSPVAAVLAPRTFARLLVLAMLVAAAGLIAATTVRGGLERFVMTSALPPADVPAVAVSSDIAARPGSTQPRAAADTVGNAPGPVSPTAVVATTAPATAALGTVEGGLTGWEAACPHTASGTAVTRWMPAYVRKPGHRLYVGGPAGTEVCVTDHAGRVSRLKLKSGALQAIDGRPPYLLQSPALDTLQIYMQGLKVRVPAQAVAILLLPGRVAATDDAHGVAQPES